MTALFSTLIFSADILCVAVLAWVSLCAMGLGRSGLIERSVGWLLLVLAVVVSSGVLLGFFGGLGRSGFFLLHVAGLATLFAWRRKWRDDLSQGFVWLADWWRLCRSCTPEGFIVLGLVFVLGFLAVLAARAEPVVFDALTYRLSRIGQWLQDGRIAHYQTDDPRLNYMPVAPDLVIAWLLGATENGFHGAALSQMMGGVLLLAATFGLARLAELSRRVALGAVVIVLGMANVAAQFTAIQSDLFTAGIFAASYLLWHRALVRGEGSWVAGIGFGLAWGAKGTMFYLAPGAALWVGWLVFKNRRQWRALLPTGSAAGLAFLLFVVPSYQRNLASYHSLFGPHEAVVLHHGGPLTGVEHLEKLRWNLQTSAVQLFDPTAQAFWCQDFSRWIGRRLLTRESLEDDRYLFLHQVPRRLLMEGVMQQTEPDGDIISCGVLAVLLFFGGFAWAGLRGWRDRTAAQIFVWSTGVVVYVLVQHALVQWHQWGYRFMVLAAPWMGVVGAWCVAQLFRKLQVAAWAVIILSQLQVFIFVQWRANQAGWQAVTQPDHALSHFIYSHWREWARKLDHADVPVRLVFPINQALAAFYRVVPSRPVELAKFSESLAATAEAAVDSNGGWLVVPAGRFKGREGRVFGQTWLFNGEGDSMHSLAAYRRLQPGENPAAMLYQFTRSFTAGGMQTRLLVKSWETPVTVRLRNPATYPWRVRAETALGVAEEEIPAGGEIVLNLPVTPEVLAELILNFEGTPDARAAMIYPITALQRP